eukprot:2925315-Pyramimonas_sp.AAC.1
MASQVLAHHVLGVLMGWPQDHPRRHPAYDLRPLLSCMLHCSLPGSPSLPSLPSASCQLPPLLE